MPISSYVKMALSLPYSCTLTQAQRFIKLTINQYFSTAYMVKSALLLNLTMHFIQRYIASLNVFWY